MPLSVPREQDETERIGAREGWRAKTLARHEGASRSSMSSNWVENRLTIEVVSPAMTRDMRTL